jgi:hypothetical protein
MDFEYDNRTGPVETNSPFLNIAAKKRKHTHTPAFSFDRRDEDWLTPGPSGQPGPHSFLESPSRNGFATPNRLREPDSRHFYFSAQTTDKPLPVPPHVQNSSAWEPRTPNSTFDFSSGGETPNTPHVDSDVATPETQLADRMTHLTSGDSPSPKKGGRRESLFKRLNPFTASPSPTKERDKDDARKYYSHKAEHRIQKRRSERSERSERSRSKKKAVVRDNGGDDSDTEPTNTRLAPPQQQGQLQQTYATSIGGFLHWIEAHPALPSVLSFYMQLLVNVFLASMFIYIMYAAWSGVMADVDIESSKHMSVIMVEMATCAKDFSANRCDNAVPHVQKLCDAWETCMSRDPRKVARASVTAKTFAKIFNSFVEEFSYKSMVCVFLCIGRFLAWLAPWQRHTPRALPTYNEPCKTTPP